MLSALTPKQRADALVKARLARAEKARLGRELYRQDYGTETENLWARLAERFDVALPRGHLAKPTAYKLAHFANAARFADGDWQEALFGTAYRHSIKGAIVVHNARLPAGQKESLRAMCAFLLEAMA